MSKSLTHLKDARVLVLGDCMLDRYVQGSVSRVSPEAPAPIVAICGEQVCLGGAGNVAAGIAALGGKVQLGGVLGLDAEGAEFQRLCRDAAIATDFLLISHHSQTICKTRVMGRWQHQLLRLDRDGSAAERSTKERILQHRVADQIASSKAVVLADYDKGSLPPSLVRFLIEECRRHRIPCIVDPKKSDFSVYRGATVITPNVAEFDRAMRIESSSAQDISEAIRCVRVELDLEHLLCTCGQDGMVLASAEGITMIPAAVRNVADVTGAGDTVVATLAMCLAQDWPIAAACRLATVAAGIAVAQPRTYVVSFDELDRAWSGESSKIIDLGTALQRIEAVRRNGHRIVFTNGCFDILHAGHLACLEQAKQQGTLLVLGLNSDSSVKMNKGAGRPRIGQNHRAALLAGLQCVDVIVIFDEQTPEALIQQIRPDVLVKGGDYDPRCVVGADIVQSYGGQVVIVPLVDDLSTTAILESQTNHR